jgi:hypothetical protein
MKIGFSGLGPWRRVGLWYKQSWMRLLGGRETSVRTSIPSARLTRAGKGATFCRTQKTGRTHSSVCNRPAAQQSPPLKEVAMQTLVERGCGLFVDRCKEQKSSQADPHLRYHHTRLVALREWLLSEGCTHVAMESTGVYWKPIYAILEGAFEIVVANVQHVKKVPGRKTDVEKRTGLLRCYISRVENGHTVPLSRPWKRRHAPWKCQCAACFHDGEVAASKQSDGTWKMVAETFNSDSPIKLQTKTPETKHKTTKHHPRKRRT